MKNQICCAAILAVAGIAASLSAQPVFQLQRTENFISLRLDGLDPVPPETARPVNPFFIGLPVSIETNGTSGVWFLGGLAENPSRQPWLVGITRVSFANLDGSTPLVGNRRSFVAIPSARMGFAPAYAGDPLDPTVATVTGGPGAFSARGWNSLSLGERATPAGKDRLLATLDAGVSQAVNLRIWDVNTQINPILEFSSAPLSAAASRLGGGSAWDYGPDRAGGNPLAAPFAGQTLPLPLTGHFGDGGPRMLSLSSANPPTPSGNIDFLTNSATGRIAWFGTFSGGGLPSGNAIPFSPALMPNTVDAGTGLPLTGNTTDSQWRDFDVHPTTGLMAGRTNNSLVVALRDPNNLVADANRLRIDPPEGRAAGVAGHNVRILHGATGGDLIIWNSRTTGDGLVTSPFRDRVRLTQITSFTAPSPFPTLPTSGAGAVRWINPDGTDATLPIINPYYDFAWVEGEQRLLVITPFGDTPANSNGHVYVFDLITTPALASSPTPCNSVALGGNVTLTASATGNGISYQWRLGGTPLVDGGTISGATTASLTITGITAGDLGSYDVVMSNGLGSVTSDPAVVQTGACGGPVACNAADIAATDGSPGADNCVNNGDFSLFFASFFSANCGATCGILPVVACDAADIAATDGSPGADGCVDNGDFQLFFSSFFSAICPDCAG